ncbi:MAG: virulence RhuM family protein [Planctomycetes bacterium]|nr:virulence RhuM family protein [Planctomycetota bacterium]
MCDSGELGREATHRRILRVQREGNRDVRREIDFHHLDAIISVGYRMRRPGFPGRRRRIAEPSRRLSEDHPREGRPGTDSPADQSRTVRGAPLTGKYSSIRRCVRNRIERTEWPVSRMEVEPGRRCGSPPSVIGARRGTAFRARKPANRHATRTHHRATPRSVRARGPKR